jgi:hypothetical protein
MSGTLVFRRALALFAAVPMLALAGCGTENSATGDDGSNATGSTSQGDNEDSASYPTQSKKACDVLTEAVAKRLLGSVAPATSPPPGNSSNSISVSTCVRTNTVTSVARSASATLLMRVAKDSTGAQGNKNVFATPPTGSQEVSGYGDRAFWNPAFGQLNILNNGNWYILSVGPIDPKRHTLAETTKLADAIKDQL